MDGVVKNRGQAEADRLRKGVEYLSAIARRFLNDREGLGKYMLEIEKSRGKDDADRLKSCIIDLLEKVK